MKIAFYDTKPYDRIWFEPLAKEYGYEILFFESRLREASVPLARDCDAVCVFVNDEVTKTVIDGLSALGVRLILLRCSGYNNVDIRAAQGKMTLLRVTRYSPYAVAEHAVALLLALNRRIHRAYSRTRDFNYNINGLMGMDLHGKTAGVVGTGQIGRIMTGILRGLGMQVLAYDPMPDENAGIRYVPLDELLEQSDVISLHCPLTKDTFHLINEARIAKMKEGAILVNTSRGALIDTSALIEGLRANRFSGVGLDVYEEEDDYFFEDKSNEIVHDEELALLTTFPNVLITSHQAFFTREAMQAIAMVTMENLYAFEHGKALANEVTCAEAGKEPLENKK